MNKFPYSNDEFLKNIKGIMRDINISIISGDITIDIKPDIRKIKKGKNRFFNLPYWDIIEKHKNNCIITGSLALKSYGLIDRDPNDIDLILIDGNDPIVKKLSKDRYGWDPDNEEMHGYYQYNNYYVDLFKYESQSFIEVDGYRFQTPLEIIKTKVEMTRNKNRWDPKDYFDIIQSFKKLNI